MMFGIPAAALAMYHTAKTTQKKQVYGWFLASSVAAFSLVLQSRLSLHLCLLRQSYMLFMRY